MNFCSRFLWLSVLPWCRERLQTADLLVRMIREIEVSGNWFGCVPVISVDVS